MLDDHDHAIAEHDITDLFVFRPHDDRGRTVLEVNVYPEVPAGGASFGSGARYEFAIDTDRNDEEDIVLQVVFSAPVDSTQRA